MKILSSKFVIWEMAAGLIITFLLKFKLASIAHLKLLLVPSIILQQIIGLWLACSSRWRQETSCLNLGTAPIKTTLKMMITLLKWWNCLVLCLRVWLWEEFAIIKFLTRMDSLRELEVWTIGLYIKFLRKNINSEIMKLKLSLISCFPCFNGTQKSVQVLKLCWIMTGSKQYLTMTQSIQQKNGKLDKLKIMKKKRSWYLMQKN